eukprot:CAMPEP_0195530888 /NCGR_PEP_ID=MMETSP0794_2-20130614/33995_1 /TAXON_ID=515487 /ORGANISM="Stephanopyxis turris, Strain CCMP 815" /LENGTH=293 /DNA_ID=CAMNT_0040662503 /DNA_START=205 /DNA_END=1086 /DNA_ORIENTATION=-
MFTTSLASSPSSSSSIDKNVVTRSPAAENVPPFVQTKFDTLNQWYNEASRIKCPFFRRRASDTIDNMAMLFRFLLIRHKSILNPLLFLDGEKSKEEFWFVGLPDCPGCQAVGKHVRKAEDGSILKMNNLPIEEVARLIRLDWSTHRYYITGRLNSQIYRDDCLFDGPDPDMPVRGLRKYLAAASHLFDHNKSFAELTEMTIDEERAVIEVRWKMGGVLMLPWRPHVKPWTGTTKYHLDRELGLVYLHQEEWDITVLEAFVCTVFPRIGEIIWGINVNSIPAVGDTVLELEQHS